nr:MAG TPA: hypothetical protein [Caudoviricetes sp.]
MDSLLADKNYAYLLGVYFGDGHIRPHGKTSFAFEMSAIDKDFVEKVRDTLSIVLDRDVSLRYASRKTSTGSQVYVTGTSSPYFGKMYEDSYDCNKIPDYVMDWSKELKLEFLSGVMDSDGFISMRMAGNIHRFECGYCVTKPFVITVQELFESIGIGTTSLQKKVPKKPRVPSYKFDVKLRQLATSGFHFNIQRKQEKLDKYTQIHFRNGEYVRFPFPRKFGRSSSQRLHAETD